MAPATPPTAIFLAPAYDHGEYLSGESLGLRSVAAALDRAGVPVNVVDECRVPLGTGLSERLATALLVGIGVQFTRQIPDAEELAREIRSRWSRPHITVGGQGSSFLWERILHHCDAIDSVCAFESDVTVVELWSRLAGGGDLSSVTGIFHRARGRIRFHGFREPVEDLDLLPLPHRPPDTSHADHHATISSSRGCAAHCSYCQSGNYGNRYHRAARWRCRSPRRVVEELVFLVNEFDVSAVSFVDDDFLGGDARGRRRAFEIARLLRGADVGLSFSIECRADEVEPDVLGELKRAGLRRVLIGVESGNASDIALYGKGLVPGRVRTALRVLRDLELDFSVGFIMFHPESTPTEVSTNIDFLRENGLGTHRSVTNRLEMYPGSPLVRYFERRGIRFHEESFRLYYEFKDPTVSIAHRLMKELLAPFTELERQIDDLRFAEITRRTVGSRPPVHLENIAAMTSDALLDSARMCLEFARSSTEDESRLANDLNTGIESVRYSLRKELGEHTNTTFTDRPFPRSVRYRGGAP